MRCSSSMAKVLTVANLMKVVVGRPNALAILGPGVAAGRQGESGSNDGRCTAHVDTFMGRTLAKKGLGALGDSV